jgi:hypothetical protein
MFVFRLQRRKSVEKVVLSDDVGILEVAAAQVLRILQMLAGRQQAGIASFLS